MNELRGTLQNMVFWIKLIYQNWLKLQNFIFGEERWILVCTVENCLMQIKFLLLNCFFIKDTSYWAGKLGESLPEVSFFRTLTLIQENVDARYSCTKKSGCCSGRNRFSFGRPWFLCLPWKAYSLVWGQELKQKLHWISFWKCGWRNFKYYFYWSPGWTFKKLKGRGGQTLSFALEELRRRQKTFVLPADSRLNLSLLQRQGFEYSSCKSMGLM